jgi:hypothetical protein
MIAVVLHACSMWSQGDQRPRWRAGWVLNPPGSPHVVNYGDIPAVMDEAFHGTRADETTTASD